ncbi:MAG: hypothetical protein AAF598_04115 [Bacteroidota bacterium]
MPISLKPTLLLFGLFLLNISSLHGQQFGWDAIFGGPEDEQCEAIFESPDGRILLFGNMRSYNHQVEKKHNGQDIVMVIVDTAGAFITSHTFGGSYDDGFLAYEPFGEHLKIYGWTKSDYGDVNCNETENDVPRGPGVAWNFVIDYDGNILSQDCQSEMLPMEDHSNLKEQLKKRYIPSHRQYMDKVHKLLPTQEKEYLALFHINKGRESNFEVALFNEQLDTLWWRTFGGSYHDQAMDVIELDSTFLIVGNTSSNDGDLKHPKSNQYHQKHWIIKIDRQGNLLWEGTLSRGGEEEVKGVQAARSGGYYIYGAYSDSNTAKRRYPDKSNYYWIMKVND